MTVIDAHQHFWNLETGSYPWLTPEAGPIYRTFEPEELIPQLAACGVDRTVLVQSANTYADTDAMLAQADAYDFVAAVVGWVPLDRPGEAAEALERYRAHPRFAGVRHLIHDEPDPDWVVREEVIEGLKLLADAGLPYDVVGVLPRHLEHVPTLAEKVPGLRLVLDHLNKPPIKDKGWEPWASLLARAASYPNVYAKVSGLNTAADAETWTAADLRPYVEHAIEVFGPDRLMFGGDWPVAILAGDYAKVWRETNALLDGLPQADRDAILGGTAARCYGIGG
ncbi:L-fuconolactonase [Thermocatellispora tengchongensis]|uniref:L-fuconolactonase n=1 Tax=Thermocatellispora tengchongensis TaxID=1073253 RepID=A0A840PKF9_9ACTN|nr:amidohydrolase family protein [Thermocatellispora tengchongensis]MBB5138090.1 L-fuconolactonase [Thermocatellispora tengchongensis]